MNRYLIIGLIIGAIGFSCNPSSFDNYIDLGNGYTFADKGGFRNEILPDNFNDRVYIFPDVVDYSSDSLFILAEQHPNEKVLKYELGFYLYERYCGYVHYLKHQKFSDSAMKGLEKYHIENDSLNYKLFKSYGASDENSARDNDIEEIIGDSLLKNDPYYLKILSRTTNYWIIDIKKDTLYGPLDSIEFKKERNKLHIDPDLQLKFER